mmetsp:Transcript_33163/g.93904  ORF Transcript_33163/g.93904 Transcript_33163/m.93904 type:complete len:542 (-) Transcript_33163:2110-3735(-)
MGVPVMKGPEYALALLARGTAEDWKKISKDEYQDLAADVFDVVDADGSGTVDRQELYNSLAHGSVSVPHSVIESLFETLDINQRGEVTEEEWCDNFEIYVKAMMTAREEIEASATPPPPTPSSRPVSRNPKLEPLNSRRSSNGGNLLRQSAPLPGLWRDSAGAPSPKAKPLIRSSGTPLSPTRPPVGRAPLIMRNGARGNTQSTRTLPVTERPNLASTSQSTRSLMRSWQVTAPARRGSDTSSSTDPGETPATPTRSSASYTFGQRPISTLMGGRRRSATDASEAGSVKPGLRGRRASATSPGELPFGMPHSQRTSTPVKQSDRSVVGPRKKTAHFVMGHYGLNRKADHGAFTAKLVRAKSLKFLLSIFRDINLTDNGTITRLEFEQYLRAKAPDILPHARGIYGACMIKRRRNVTIVEGEETLDFTTLLRTLYPAASSEDIRELLNIITKEEKHTINWGGKVKEAGELFRIYNTSKDGWLTPSQFLAGMRYIGLPQDDMDNHYYDLFPDETDLDPVNFARFFEWFTGHELPEQFIDESEY